MGSAFTLGRRVQRIVCFLLCVLIIAEASLRGVLRGVTLQCDGRNGNRVSFPINAPVLTYASQTMPARVCVHMMLAILTCLPVLSKPKA